MVTTEDYNFYDLGYNKNLTKTDKLITDAGQNTTSMDSSVSPVSIRGGELIGNLNLVNGYMQSDNFVTGVSGWQLSADSAELNVPAAVHSLDIPDTTTDESFHVKNDGDTFWGCNLADWASSVDNANAYVLKTGIAKFQNVAITGGTVGGQDVNNIGYIADPTADAVPTGLTASDTGITTGINGTQSAYVTLTWNAISTNTFNYYSIRYRINGYTYYHYAEARTNTIDIEGLLPNITYNFGIASVNKFGIQSAFSTDIDQLTATDTTLPATVADVTATGSIQYSLLTWTSNTEYDLASYDIYRNTVDNSATADLIGNSRTNYFIDGNRTGGTLLYYWVKARDTSGNVSAAFSTVASCTPRNVASADANIAQAGWTQTCVFSSDDTNTVSWAAGTFTASNGDSYEIGANDTDTRLTAAGLTSPMDNLVYIYLHPSESETEYQCTYTSTDSVGDGKVLIGIAQNNTYEAIFQIFGGMGGIYMDGANLVAGTVTTNEIAANTIKAGNIEAGTVTATQIDTDSITSLGNLVVGASKILITGTTYFSDWLGDDGGVTKIEGDNIVTGSVTASQVSFTVIGTDNIVGTINGSAEAEGIRITAARINIDGNTNFSAGYNPTQKVTTFAQNAIPTSIAAGDIWIDTDDDNKMYRATAAGDTTIEAGVHWTQFETTATTTFAQAAVPTSLYAGDIWYDTDDGNKMYWAEIAGADEITAGEWEAVPDANKLNILGGSYDSAASGARVRIFPDANTGIQVIDDAAADVFKVIVGGTNVGDVVLGDYANNKGLFYDKSESTFNIKGVVTITGGSGIASFSDAGDLATEDTVGASDCDATIISGGKIITGLLTADNITTGTLTGLTIQTATSGERLRMQGSPANEYQFLDDDTKVGHLKIDNDGSDGYYAQIYIDHLGPAIEVGSTVGAAETTYFYAPFFSGSGRAAVGQVTMEGNNVLAGLSWAGGADATWDFDLGDDLAKISSDIVPSGTLDLGSSGDGWANLYFDYDIDSYIKVETYTRFKFAATGNIFVGRSLIPLANTYDLGSSTQYWDDINYKDLIDRGCLGYFDDGVELQSGEIVSDMEALKTIKKHPTLMTTYDTPRIDYSTMPKVVYDAVPIAEKDIYEDEIVQDKDGNITETGKRVVKWKKGEKIGEDGANFGALVSIMLGAVKELDKRLELLEKN